MNVYAARGQTLGAATATIVSCVAVAFCEGFDLQAAGVAARGIASEFNPTPDQLGTFFSASTLGLFGGALLGGRISDSFGRKRTLIWSVVTFGIFSILTAAAPDIHTLTWARLLTGLGFGGAFPNLLALVNESSSAGRRNANVALVYSGMPFGGAIASLLSMLSAPAHWRVIFIAGGVIPLALTPILIGALRESSGFERLRHSSEFTGMALITGATPKAGGFVAIFANGRAALTVMLWSCLFLALLILYLILSWLPTLLVGNGMSNAAAAAVQVAFNVGGGLSALVIGQLLEGKSRNISLAAAFIGVPLFVFLLSKTPPQLSLVMLIVFGLGCAILATQGFMYATAPQCYPTLIRGVGVGAAVAMGRLGSIVGPKLGGSLKAAGHGSSQLFADVLPLAVLGSVMAFVLAWQIARLRQAHSLNEATGTET